jgi:5'-nucleotidase
MISNLRSVVWGAVISGLILTSIGCDGSRVGRAPIPANPKTGTPVKPPLTCSKAPIALGENESILTILGTNDIHGSIAPKISKDGKKYGGMAFWTGAIKSIRDATKKNYGDRGGVLVLDGGDQFQGTLLSNFSEGALMFSLLGDATYDAMVPGNHDYDFGPEDWLVDQVTPTSADQDPRGVIKKISAKAPFPLLSSNAYLKASLKTLDGKPATVESQGCGSSEPLDWSKAERPEFLKSYLIKNVSGVRVAIIGLDNVITPTTTTAANVSDLCFRTAADEYKSVRKELDGKADLFVLVTHDGDINNDKNLTKLIRTIQSDRPDAVDAVVGGHTHSINLIRDESGVVGIQSGANGDRFGRIDLVIDAKTKKVIRGKTRVAAGAMLLQTECDKSIDAFCEASAGVRVSYDCEPVVESDAAIAKIMDAEKEIAPLKNMKLGEANAPIKKDRDNESPLLNILTDTYRRAANVDLALINTGGVRTDIESGVFTYEKLYAISPFNNRAVILNPMKVETLKKILTRSARTCGKSGAVLGSGVRVTYERGDCKNPDANGEDPNGRVVTIHIDDGGKDGALLYDARDPANVILNERNLRIATLDFLEAGGSGYVYFKEAPREADLGIFREVLKAEFEKNPAKLEAKIDGRFRNVLGK